MASLPAEVAACVRPLNAEKVYKDECVYSFDSPLSEDGLFVSLQSFIGVSKAFLPVHHNKTNETVYLNIKKTATRVEAPEDAADAPEPDKLAIGVEGGFSLDVARFEYETATSIYVYPEGTTYAVESAPENVQATVAAVIAAESARVADESALAWSVDDVPIKESEHAKDLVQVENPPQIPPTGHQCCKCDLTENLWLNLTDGAVLCGRRNWDGSGGNNHAVEHYQETNNPLCVKLGTITTKGADVYSYAEDDMVLDPKLEEHLAHFGITMGKMAKTDKTMAELELEANKKYKFEAARIEERGVELIPVYGPGLTGMRNMGNSCYMNSVMQCLFSTNEFIQRYHEGADAVFATCPANPANDLVAQMCKLGNGLQSGKYSFEADKNTPPDAVGVAPFMLKTLVGQDHPEFATREQQDACQYFQHVLSLLTRTERANGFEPAKPFEFKLETRLECVTSGAVRYTTEKDNVLALPVPMEAVTNAEEVAAWKEREKVIEADRTQKTDADVPVPSNIPFEACLAAFAAPEQIENWESPVLNARSTASRAVRVKTFPKYLTIQMRKFAISENWQPIKLDVSVTLPELLDIEHLRSKGLQEGEVEMPGGGGAASGGVEFDEEVVMTCMQMGFSENACKRAAIATHGQGVEAASNWLMMHMEDPDFNDPPAGLGGSGGGGGGDCKPEDIVSLTSMGFSEAKAKQALQATDNDVARATEWIFSHLDDPEPTEDAATGGAEEEVDDDGPGRYQLFAFISHTGGSATSGHYLCHIKKDGRWVIFNDENVRESQNPPFDLGYVYYYQRIE